MPTVRRKFLESCGVLNCSAKVLKPRVCGNCLWWRSTKFRACVRGFCAVSWRQWHPAPKSAVSAAILMFSMFLSGDSSWSRKDSLRKSKWQQISCAPKTESITAQFLCLTRFERLKPTSSGRTVTTCMMWEACFHGHRELRLCSTRWRNSSGRWRDCRASSGRCKEPKSLHLQPCRGGTGALTCKL